MPIMHTIYFIYLHYDFILIMIPLVPEFFNMELKIVCVRICMCPIPAKYCRSTRTLTKQINILNKT